MNVAILTGVITREPQLRLTADGEHVLSFAILVQTGTRAKPKAMWVECSFWGHKSVGVAPLVQVGTEVTVSGPIKLEEYSTVPGQSKMRLRISIDQLDISRKD